MEILLAHRCVLFEPYAVVVRTVSKVTQIYIQSGMRLNDYQTIVQAVAYANANNFDGIELHISSGGGVACGLQEATAALQSSQIPTTSLVSGYAYSAAYWLASSCQKLYVRHESVGLGSIGAFTGILDTTEMDKKMGVKPIIIRSGALKAKPVNGWEEVTEEDIERLQAEINAITEVFRTHVRTVRGLEKGWTDSSQTYTAANAPFLHDGIQPINIAGENMTTNTDAHAQENAPATRISAAEKGIELADKYPQYAKEIANAANAENSTAESVAHALLAAMSTDNVAEVEVMTEETDDTQAAVARISAAIQAPQVHPHI